MRSLSPSFPPLRTPLNTVILGLRLLDQHLSSLGADLQMKEMGEGSSCQEGSGKGDNLSSLTLVEKAIGECKELIHELDENTNLAVMTLNDLINYDKIESKTFTIEQKPVKICQLIKKTVNLLDLQAKEKEINLTVSIDGDSHDVDLLDVMGDSVKLSQVFRNLVSNALKFTPSGGNVSVFGQSISSSSTLSSHSLCSETCTSKPS
jgi:signal transduction histidine kinase